MTEPLDIDTFDRSAIASRRRMAQFAVVVLLATGAALATSGIRGCAHPQPAPPHPASVLPRGPVAWRCSAGGVTVNVVSTDAPDLACDQPCASVCGRLPLEHPRE